MIKTFVIQTIKGEVVHDFSFHLIEAIKYNNWFNNEKTYDYYFTDRIGATDWIPVGSVEFVLDTLLLSRNIENVKPINIPQELMKSEYLKRWVRIWNTYETTINAGEEPIFIKDNTKIKGHTGIINHNQGFAEGEWLVSEFVDIKSEWRAFVFEDKLVGLQNYSGDFTIFPDVELIHKMIDDYKGLNPCYTIDVGINNKGTFLIECHDFFSCGLYGFADYRILPRMFIATWEKLTRKS